MSAVLTVIDPVLPGETWQQSIARRLRGSFAQQQMSMSAVAKVCGFSQTAFSRRMTGLLPFTVDEIDTICSNLKLERDYILTGARTLPESDSGRLLLPRLDSNQEPFDEYPYMPLAAGAVM